MSDYSKITNFLSKDSLSLNDPAKYVKGSEIDAEYNAIAVAIATKADTASPTLTTPTMSSPTITGTITAAIANFSGLVTAALGLTVSGAAFNSRGITDNATAKALTLSGSGANSLTIANGTTVKLTTNAGGLSFNPGDSGTTSVLFPAVASVANWVSIYGSATGAGVTVTAQGADTDVGLVLGSKGAENIYLYAGGAFQVVIDGTASADRYITLTGANAANPKIATSAGSLDIGSPVVFTGQTVGTTVGATGAASALPANPLGYITTAINGTACKIPYYTA